MGFSFALQRSGADAQFLGDCTAAAEGSGQSSWEWFFSGEEERGAQSFLTLYGRGRLERKRGQPHFVRLLPRGA